MYNIQIFSLLHIGANSDTSESLDNITVIELKNACRACTLSTEGRKKDLIDCSNILMESLATQSDAGTDRCVNSNSKM